ncbi:hypothetical protein [Streptomyces sp. NPDC088910]|uniref:hypothetical protein n=1 Tax=Streptomyces sp. NPDC088910 TaxID=3365911 RepID=UPI0037FEC5B2
MTAEAGAGAGVGAVSTAPVVAAAGAVSTATPVAAAGAAGAEAVASRGVAESRSRVGARVLPGLDRAPGVLADELAGDLAAAGYAAGDAAAGDAVGDRGSGSGWLDRPALLRRLAAALAVEVPATADRLVAAGPGAQALGAAVSLETGLPFAALVAGAPPFGVIHPGETVVVIAVDAASAAGALPLLREAGALPHSAAVVVAPSGEPPAGLGLHTALVRRTATGYAPVGPLGPLEGVTPADPAGPAALAGPAGPAGPAPKPTARQENRTTRQESAMPTSPLPHPPAPPAPAAKSPAEPADSTTGTGAALLADDPATVERAGAALAELAARYRPEAVVSWNATADVLLAHVVAHTLGLPRRVVVEDLGRLIVEDVLPGERTVVVARGGVDSGGPGAELAPLVRAVTGHGGRVVAVCSLAPLLGAAPDGVDVVSPGNGGADRDNGRTGRDRDEA